jgi:cholesterol transport system auxiliary component
MHMLASPSSLQSEVRGTQENVRETQHAAVETQRGIRAPQRISARRRGYFQTAAFAGFFLLVAISISSCGAARPIRFYQLTPPEVPAVTGAPQPYPVSLVLGAINSSPLYAQDRIVYGTEGEGMGLYLYERWAEPPTQMMQEILLRELRGGNHFREVYPLRSSVHGDYLLRGRLYDFKEVSGSSVVARVNFFLELRDTKNATTVWSYSYHQDEPVVEKTAAGVVAALDKNMARGLRESSAGITQYFADHPPQQAAQN